MIVDMVGDGSIRLSHVYIDRYAWCIAYEAYPGELEFVDEGPFTTHIGANIRLLELAAEDPILNKGLFAVPIKAFGPWIV